jgi:hypothetical protein
MQDTQEILSYMLIASLEIQKQKISSTATKTTAQTTSKVNNFQYFEESNTITIHVSNICIFSLFL